MDDEARFLSYVRKTDYCWEWQGPMHPNGYGRFGKNRRKWLAHRMSYSIHFGSIPRGMFVCHHCDNRACVNPRHLFIGTHQDNVDDMIRKGRGLKGRRNGENNPHAKLTADEVRAIRSSSEGRVALSKRFGVSRSAINDIIKRRSWA